MRNLTFAILTVLSACGPAAAPPDGPTPGTSPDAEPALEPSSSPGDPPSSPAETEWPCASDADCVLATRASLGCCDPCPTVEAMSVAQQDEVADLCGLHHGGETCPAMSPLECPEEDPAPPRAACRHGSCRAEQAPGRSAAPP